MNKITEEDNTLQTEREPTSPPSLKRPRTHCTVTNDHSGDSSFHCFPELLTFQKTIDSPSSESTLQKNVVLVCIAENVDIQDEKPYEQLQNTKLSVIPITKVTTSHTDDADIESSKVFITAEGHLLHLGKDEQPPVSEIDKFCSYWPDDAGGALTESHTSKDTSTDMSSHSDCKQSGKSLEDEAPGGWCLPAGNDKDGRQVQHSVSQIQAFTLNSSDDEVRCQTGFSYENVLRDVGFRQSAEVEASNQKRDEHGFSENILFSKEEEGNSPTSSNDYADSKSYCSYSEEDRFENFVEDVKNEKILELQICENGNVACCCDGETKGQVNENGKSTNSVLSVAECAEGSIVSYDVVLARNTETDDLCGAKGEHAAGKMVAEACNETADHTTETRISGRITQEPVVEDNNAGPFSVIDPAIWSETDREAEEKCCNSENTAGVELSPSIIVCEMETPLPLCFDVRPSQEVSAPNQIRQFNHQSTTQQCTDEKKDLCQSYTEPQACSVTFNETHNMIGNEGSSPCWPAKPPSSGDGRQESHSTVGHQLKEQDQSDSFPIRLDNLWTQEAEQPQAETVRLDGTTEVKEREEMTVFEEAIKTDEHENLEKAAESEEKRLQQNELHKEDTTQIATGDCISDWTEGEISECDRRITCVEDELEKKFECFSDHQYSADMSMKVETVKKERKEVTNVGEEMKTDDWLENSKIVVKSEDDLQQQNEHKTDTIKVSYVECISEWTDGNMSTSCNKLTLVSQHEQRNTLSSCPDQHRAETCVVENIDDLLVFTSPTRDAVVPCQNNLSHSQNANNNPTVLNSSGRFSPVASAFTLYSWVSGGFDTFEKIQLSPDDDNDDADLGNSPLLTNLPGQLLKTPQQQLSHSMPGAESDEYDQAPEEKEEEEVERFEYHPEYMANGFLNSDTSCNELPNFTSAADIIAARWAEQQSNRESACDSCEPYQSDLHTQSKSSTGSTESDSPASDVNNYPDFEMKKQFDVVLKELNLYFDISINDFASDRASSPEQCRDITEPLETDSKKEHLSSPDLACHRSTSTDDADEDRSLEMCGGEPVVSCTGGRGDGEQEVPLGSHMCPETSLYTAEKHREPWEMEQRRKTWSPSFMCLPLLEQLSYRPPEHPKRLEPLRTCTRPIRVGLSKRAKTKHLHCPHPYK